MAVAVSGEVFTFMTAPWSEYAIAQLGAVQVWAAAMQDQVQAVERYRQALSLGNTVSVPEFYRAAGIRFAFDEEMLRGAQHEDAARRSREGG